MTYEYLCTACAHEWEAEQRISEAPLTDCPACGAATAKRQISAGAGFILKGSGWYADGYASSKGGGKAETKTETKTETKSDSKPAADPSTATKSDKPSKTDKGQQAA
jgi:putative FmdB family regulatory protein